MTTSHHDGMGSVATTFFHPPPPRVCSVTAREMLLFIVVISDLPAFPLNRSLESDAWCVRLV